MEFSVKKRSKMIWGCDYNDGSSEELQFFIVDASSEEEAHQKAIEQLKSYRLPKRNLVNLFKIDL